MLYWTVILKDKDGVVDHFDLQAKDRDGAIKKMTEIIKNISSVNLGKRERQWRAIDAKQTDATWL